MVCCGNRSWLPRVGNNSLCRKQSCQCKPFTEHYSHILSIDQFSGPRNRATSDQHVKHFMLTMPMKLYLFNWLQVSVASSLRVCRQAVVAHCPSYWWRSTLATVPNGHLDVLSIIQSSQTSTRSYLTVSITNPSASPVFPASAFY